MSGETKKDAKKDKDTVPSAASVSVTVPVDSDSARLGEKMLKDVFTAISTMNEGMEKMLNRIGALESKFEGNRRVTLSRGGGSAEAVSSGDFQDGQNFFNMSLGQDVGRHSFGSTGTHFGAKDPGTKLERPKFVVKNTKVKDGKKSETVQFSDYLEFFDEYDQYMEAWETIPANCIDGTPQPYPNKDRVAVLNIPFKYAKQLSGRLKLIYDHTDLEHMSLREVQSATYWKDLSTKDIRKRIGLKFEAEVSVKGTLDILKRIEFKSQFGLIDGIAFADYQHDLKKEIQRIQAGGNFVVNKIQLKDIIIDALPDKTYQRELYAKYGHVGTLLMNYEDFSISLIFNDVERRIENITKEGLRAAVNKAVRERDAVSLRVHHKVANLQEMEDEIQDQVNAALVGDKKCKNVGVGSDKLLKCRFLGGDKATCTFEHPSSDLALKGKGVSKDQPSPQWLNTGRKVYNMAVDYRSEFPDCDEEFWFSHDTLPPFPGDAGTENSE
jgi:hypothetical protein